MAEDRFKPHRIQEPIVAEDIDYNFDVIFRRLAELLDDGLSILAPRRGGTGIGDYTVGDLLVAISADALGVINATTAGYVLITNGAGVEPGWGKVRVNGSTSHLTGFTAKGDIIVYDGSNPQLLARGTDGQVLKSSASASTGLEWGAVASAGDAIDWILTDGDHVMLDDNGNVLYAVS